MENSVNKSCHFCLRIRPSKHNRCIISKKNIENPREHSCKDFLLDDWAVRLEKSQEPVKNEDEADQQFFYLNFNSYICS